MLKIQEPYFLDQFFCVTYSQLTFFINKKCKMLYSYSYTIFSIYAIISTQIHLFYSYSSCISSNLVNSPIKLSPTIPVGPLRCFATISSANAGFSVFLLYTTSRYKNTE